MSVSLWRWTEACDGQPCPGDCDNCDRNTEELPETAKAYNVGFDAGFSAALASLVTCGECRKAAKGESESVYCVVHARHMPKHGFCCYGERDAEGLTYDERVELWQKTIIEERNKRWEGK